MSCEPAQVPTDGWPANFSASMFPTIEDFCGENGFGLVCWSTPDPSYLPKEGHEFLQHLFPESCPCQCYSHEPETPDKTSPRPNTFRTGAQGTGAGQKGATNPDPNASNTWGSQVQNGGGGNTQDSSANMAQCRAGACNGFNQCGSCVCVASQSTRPDARDGRFWTSGCRGMDNTIPAKRDAVGMACPCNSTYVSKSCCSAPDGIVFEPAELNLGVLVS